MKAFHTYWSVNAIRGVLTLIAATVVFALPRAAAYAFEIPVILLISVGCFAAFSLLEPGFLLLTAGALPKQTRGRTALQLQAAFGIPFAALLFLIGYRVLPLAALFWIAAAQAGVAAVAEFNVARTTHREYGCLSCYSTAIVLALAAVTLPFAGLLGAADMTAALAAYLAAYGFSDFALGSRMLFLEFRAEHPAAALSDAWRLDLEPVPAPAAAPAPQPAAASCSPALTCSACIDDAFCNENSLQSQIAAILSARQPSIVTTVRAAAVLRSAEQPSNRHAFAHR